MVSFIALSIVYSVLHIFILMLNAFILSVVIQSVILLSDIMFFLTFFVYWFCHHFLMMFFDTKIDCFEKYLIWCAVSNVIMVSFIELSIVYAVHHIFILMLNAFILCVVIQIVILLSVIMFFKILSLFIDSVIIFLMMLFDTNIDSFEPEFVTN